MAVSYRVASRYAKSITSLAEEQKVLDQIKADFELFVHVYEGNRDFQLMLESPVVGHDKKRKILSLIFDGKLQKLTMLFFDIITRKNREADLYGIAKQILVEYNLIRGIQLAEVRTAIPLSASLKKQFSDIVSKAMDKDVILSEKVNEDLIGGYILRVEDKQIDTSLKSSIENLRYKFKGQ